MTTLLLALGTTIVVEGLIAAAILRRFVWLESTAVQLFTWPIAQSLLWRGFGFWPIEAAVAIVETILWRIVIGRTWRRAAMVSFAANATTALIARFVFNT